MFRLACSELSPARVVRGHGFRGRSNLGLLFTGCAKMSNRSWCLGPESGAFSGRLGSSGGAFCKRACAAGCNRVLAVDVAQLVQFRIKPFRLSCSAPSCAARRCLSEEGCCRRQSFVRCTARRALVASETSNYERPPIGGALPMKGLGAGFIRLPYDHARSTMSA